MENEEGKIDKYVIDRIVSISIKDKNTGAVIYNCDDPSMFWVTGNPNSHGHECQASLNETK